MRFKGESDNKQLLDKDFVLSAEPKAEADNTYRDFDYLGYHKGKGNNDKHTVARNLNWYCYRKSCIARATYRLIR